MASMTESHARMTPKVAGYSPVPLRPNFSLGTVVREGLTHMSTVRPDTARFVRAREMGKVVSWRSDPTRQSTWRGMDKNHVGHIAAKDAGVDCMR
jgi:hypothetical protein